MTDSPLSSATPRKRRRWLAALVTLGLTAAGVGIYAVAANAAVNITFVDANGNVSPAVAETLPASNPGDISGNYFCNSTITYTSKINVANNSTLNLIIGDSCNLTINSGNTGIEVTSPAILNIFKGALGSNAINGTGWVKAIGKDGADIGESANWNNGPIRIFGGNIYAEGNSLDTNVGDPGIGSNGPAGGAARGAITISGDANVYAKGSDYRTSGSTKWWAAAGIGTGAYGDTSVAPGTITIQTSGMVQAVGGLNQTGTRAPGIGQGTNSQSAYLPIIGTYAVSAVASGAGTVATKNWQNFFDETLTRSNVAVGSYVTQRATPNSGAYLYSATYSGLATLGKVSGPGPSTTDSSASVYRTTPSSLSGTATYQFQQSTNATIVASPANQQTRPGNVAVTMTLKNPANSATLTGVSQTSGAQLYINGVLTQTANVTSGVATFTIASPPAGTYDYQVKFLGTTGVNWASDSNIITGYKVLGVTQSALTLTSIATSYVYGDAPVPVSVSGGSGTGELSLTTSDPTIASFGTVANGSGTLTIHQAGKFTITGSRAGDSSYDLATTTTPTITIAEATPAATLTRIGGTTSISPVDLTMRIERRGTGSTPQGLVQFYMKSLKLGDPLPLVDSGDGTASVSLTGIPLTKSEGQAVSAVFLGQPGKYKTVTESDFWYLGPDGFCIVNTP